MNLLRKASRKVGRVARSSISSAIRSYALPVPEVVDGIPEEHLIRTPLSAQDALPTPGHIHGEFGPEAILEIDKRCFEDGKLILNIYAQGPVPDKLLVRIGDVRGRLTIVLAGSKTDLEIGNSPKLHAHFGLGPNSEVKVGDKTTSSGLQVSCQDGRVIIGRDCQIAQEAMVMGAAHHGVVDLSGAEPKLMQTPADTRVGNHVWLGFRSYIGPKAVVGDGCVVAAMASVVGTMPDHHLVAGNPAVPRRSHTGWSRFYRRIDESSQSFFDSHDI